MANITYLLTNNIGLAQQQFLQTLHLPLAHMLLEWHMNLYRHFIDNGIMNAINWIAALNRMSDDIDLHHLQNH